MLLELLDGDTIELPDEALSQAEVEGTDRGGVRARCVGEGAMTEDELG